MFGNKISNLAFLERLFAPLTMDPDQDLLDALDRKEGLSTASVTALIVGMSVLTGTVFYLSLLTQNFNREIWLDGAVLTTLAVAIGLIFGYRKLRC
jgi:hypothetical protein